MDNIMKRKTVLAIFLAVLTPLLWLSSGGSPNWAEQSQAMGQKVAGGWLATLKMGDVLLAEVMFSLTADGCMLINGQLIRNFPDVGDVGMNTTAHGSWKRTGHNEIEAFVLLFQQDNNGQNFRYETGRSYLTLMEGGTKLEGTMDTRLIKASGDPLNPNADEILYEGTLKVAARPIKP